MTEKSLRGPALSEAIRDYIKTYILDNGLKAGDPLPPEPQLMSALGVGRSSVREAVKGLESLGLVEIRRGNGLFVRDSNFDPITELLSYTMRFDSRVLGEVFEIRVWLESAVMPDVIAAIDAATLAELDAILATWRRQAEAGGVFEELDRRFHKTLYRCLGNSTLDNILEVFWTTLKTLKPALKNVDGKQALETVAAHDAILAAVKAGDSDLARERLTRHFEPSVLRPQGRAEQVSQSGRA